MKKVFDALKTLYGPQSSETSHSLVQMELVFLLTKPLSWKDRLNTLIVSVGHHLSMMKLTTGYRRWNGIRCLMSSQPSLTQLKQENKDEEQMQCLQRSTKQEVLVTENLTVISYYVEKRRHPSRIKTYNKYPPIQTARESSSAIIIGVSLYFQLLGRFLQESYWTDWMINLNSQGFYQKKKKKKKKKTWIQEVQRYNWHDRKSKTAAEEMPGIEFKPLHDLCRPYQNIWQSQSRGTLTNYGTVWQTDMLDKFVPLCWLHGKRVPIEEKMWQRWSHNKPQNDWSGISASTWKTLQGVCDHNKRWTVQVVDKFTYLRSASSKVLHIDDEVNDRIAKTSAAFGRLCQSFFLDFSRIRLVTKLKLYVSVVLPKQLHAFETWPIYQKHARRLSIFHKNIVLENF